VNLSPGAGSATFYPAAGCNGSPITSVAINNGTSSASFNFTSTVPGSLTITASGSLTSAMQTETITFGPADHLAFNVSPGNGTVNQALTPSPQVTVKDAFNNTVSNATNSITVSLVSSNGAVLAGTTTGAPTSGIVTFAGLSVNLPGTGYTLSATSTPVLTAGSSTSFAIVGTPTQFAFSNPARTAQAGGCTPVTVESRDATNTPAPVTSDTVVNLSATGGSATFYPAANCTGGATTSATITAGTTAATFIFAGTVAGPLTITASGTLTSASQTETITFGIADHLAFVVSPGNGTVNQPLTPSPQVAIKDGFNNTVTSATNSITVSLVSSNGAVLSGTATGAPTSGVATFAGLSINLSGTGYTLSTTATPSLAAGASTSFSVVPTTPTQFAFSNPVRTPQAGGCTPVTVESRDANNAATPVTSDTVVNLSVPGSATLFAGADCTGGAITSVKIAAGTSSATFIFAGTVAGPLTITASGALASASQTETITFGIADRVAFVISPGSGSVNQPLTPSPQVAIQDGFHNTVTTATNVIALSMVSTNGAVLSGTTMGTPTAGIVTFDGLSVDKSGTGYTLKATSTPLMAASSAPFDVAGLPDAGPPDAGPSDAGSAPDPRAVNGYGCSTGGAQPGLLALIAMLLCFPRIRRRRFAMVLGILGLLFLAVPVRAEEEGATTTQPAKRPAPEALVPAKGFAGDGLIEPVEPPATPVAEVAPPKIESAPQAAEPPGMASAKPVGFGLYLGAVVDPVGKRIGPEVALGFDIGQNWQLRAGAVISTHSAGRLSFARHLFTTDSGGFSLNLAARALLAPFPGGTVIGGGLALAAQIHATSWLDLELTGAGEGYKVPGGSLITPLGAAGLALHF
jgi:hypothetical protein